MYPDRSAQELLNEEVIPVKVPIADSPELAKRFDVVWTPTFVFVDGEGSPRHRIAPASLPVDEFLAVTLTGVGRAYLDEGRFDDAIRRFDRVVEGHPRALAAPEAMYWRGVARYRKGEKDALSKSWKDIASKYPSSYWAKATTFLGRK